MRFFLAVLLCFTGGLYSAFVFGQNVTGTWTWVGAGCRDRSLSADSHVTKSKSNNPFQIRASELTLNSDGSAAMTIEMADNPAKNETGNYTVENNRVLITDPSMPAGKDQVLILNIVDGNLLLAFSTFEELDTEDQSLDENYGRLNSDICGSKTYVYVFSNVD